MEHGGSYQRFVTGLLLVDSSKKHWERTLLPKSLNSNKNKNKRTKPQSDDPTSSSSSSWSKTDLPSVDAAVVEFPCTFGFVSALIMSYRVRCGFMDNTPPSLDDDNHFSLTFFGHFFGGLHIIHTYIHTYRLFLLFVGMRKKRVNRITFLSLSLHVIVTSTCAHIMRYVSFHLLCHFIRFIPSTHSFIP
jgi:hypothetical protein